MSEKFSKSYWNFVQIKYNYGYNFASLLPLLIRQINWIKKYVPNKVRVLDVGCGFGYFLKLCDRSSWKTYGIDISDYAISVAKENTQAQLVLHNIESFEQTSFRSNYFDLITMFEVIEHLSSPHTALKELHRILRNRGRLAVSTPNLLAVERIMLKALIKENKWHGFYDETHVNLFTPSSLKMLLKQNHFKVLDLKTPFRPAPSSLNSLLEKTQLGGDIWLLAEKT